MAAEKRLSRPVVGRGHDHAAGAQMGYGLSRPGTRGDDPGRQPAFVEEP
jgi:hypothetical protein